MKKLMFTLALVSAAFTSAQAQKQLGGEHNIDGVRPIRRQPHQRIHLEVQKLHGRRPRIARDFGLEQHHQQVLVVPENSLGNWRCQRDSPDLYLSNIHSSFELGLGYEMHFKGTGQPVSLLRIWRKLRTSSLTLQRDHFSAVKINGATVDQAWEDDDPPSGTCGTTPTS